MKVESGGEARGDSMGVGEGERRISRAVVIGNGKAGAENQCVGLVRGLGLGSSYTLHRVSLPTRLLSALLPCLPLSLHLLLQTLITKLLRTQPGTLSANPHRIAALARRFFHSSGPMLVVASGQDTVSVSSAIRHLSRGSAFVVQIQHPRTRLDRFDLVVTPHHDYYPLTPHARNQIPWFLTRFITPRSPPDERVILTVGALHVADVYAIRDAVSAWRHQLRPLPKPLLVLNLGGPTKGCRYGADLALNLNHMLRNVLWSCGSVRVSFSRRTPKKIAAILQKDFQGNPKVWIWDGRGENPHLGHLAWGDCFVVTADSVSMLSEACSTGKPVYVVGGEYCTWKFGDFLRRLMKRGCVKPFTGFEDISTTWAYSPLNDVSEVAKSVEEALAKRGWTISSENLKNVSAT